MTDITRIPGATPEEDPAVDEFERLVCDYRVEIEALRRELKLPWLLNEKQAAKLIPVSASTIRAEKAKIGYTSFRGLDFFTTRLLAVYLAKQSKLPCPTEGNQEPSPEPDNSANTGSIKSPGAIAKPTTGAASGTTKPGARPDTSRSARRLFRPHAMN